MAKRQRSIVYLVLFVVFMLLLIWWATASDSQVQGTNMYCDKRVRKEYPSLSIQLSDSTAILPTYDVQKICDPDNPILDASLVPLVGEVGIGTAKIVDARTFPILQKVTAYLVEIWAHHMRVPHWHDSVEIGYLVEGVLQIYIAAPFPSRLTGSKGEPAGETKDKSPHMEIFTIRPGQAWMIPSGRVHSLNALNETATMIVGFSDALVSDIDIPVAFGAVPAYVKRGYVGDPHDALLDYKGAHRNPLFAWNPIPYEVTESPQGHLYRFDLMKNPVSFTSGKGMFNWAVETNWPIVRDMSIGLTILTPGHATDAMWYPTTDCLFVLARGRVEFSILTAPTQQEPKVHYRRTEVLFPGSMVFVPRSQMVVFRCLADQEAHMLSFYNRADPKLPISLSSFSLFSYPFRQASLNQYGTFRNPDPIFVDANPARKLLEGDKFPVLLGGF